MADDSARGLALVCLCVAAVASTVWLITTSKVFSFVEAGVATLVLVLFAVWGFAALSRDDRHETIDLPGENQ